MTAQKKAALLIETSTTEVDSGCWPGAVLCRGQLRTISEKLNFFILENIVRLCTVQGDAIVQVGKEQK